MLSSRVNRVKLDYRKRCFLRIVALENEEKMFSGDIGS
jgi:hypothetical protein